jgi:hypothetical protein
VRSIEAIPSCDATHSFFWESDVNCDALWSPAALLNYAVNDVTGLRKAEPCSVLYKKVPSRERLRPMKTTRHTINVPAEMEQLLNDRIRDFRSLSAYFVALCFTDLLYLPKRPIAKAFANASWRQQRHAIESLVTLRKQGWKGVNLKVHFDAVTQVEKVAQKCLKPDDWLLDHIQEELAFMRGTDLRR